MELRKYISHQVIDMDATMVQNCVICGENICDYRNAMWPNDQPAPKGFASGPVFVSAGNPKIFKTNLDPADPFLPCNYNN